jgi:hypothetical protein
MYEFPCTGPITADVRAASGRTRIVAEDRSTVTVEVLPESGGDAARNAVDSTKVEFSGDTLLVEAPRGMSLLRRGGALNITVHIPTGSRLAVRTASADVTCTGRFDAGELHTASGDVTVDDIVGDLQCNTASGDLRIGSVTGRLSVHSASGDIRVTRVTGDVDCKSASGDIRLGEVGGSVSAGTASGDIEVGAMRSGEARLSTASGDLVVGVTEGTAVWMDLNTLSGRSSSELPVGDAPASTDGPQLRVYGKAASGDITIRRARIASTPQD